MVLEDAPDWRTRRQLLDDWPADFPRPEDITLYRWLDRAVRLTLVLQQGTGRKNDPFRYALPHKEAHWQQDPMVQFNRLMDESQRRVLEDLDRAQHGAA